MTHHPSMRSHWLTHFSLPCHKRGLITVHCTAVEARCWAEGASPWIQSVLMKHLALSSFSSAENAMISNRGTIGSYQEWATAVNDSSWTFDNILPYCAKSTHYAPASSTGGLRAANANHITLPSNPDAYNVSGGPVQISYAYSIPLSSWTQLSLREIGFPDR
jgi:hypothetical protein